MGKSGYLLLVILVWIQYSLWLGKNGILVCINIYNERKLYKCMNNIDQMKIRNSQLLLEIHDLLYGYELIEEHARYNLGMIKKDEIFYCIKFND
ncbi:cell division protein [Candidatus Blochmanniella vafra str. BVAF]|uniref:Cell division protein FtsB n=1 Tax=Blochmanniella vafra (strain BVAF) TaxID=859654 RepID=E8Q5S6_BLOVB|nr:septum formation initiator family protein [Candidatus Blochmannia vafer]ADV33573.1 cell division protein [Candidatus Blochmannia vafer str. BVAF]